ncbi:MAG: adenylate/guanylate cyclase domain-containing protein [Actinomycetota bacterium]|nr:adenylate/guanylate cyclase domain-containing protein [Actinomycetota bacterium]
MTVDSSELQAAYASHDWNRTLEMLEAHGDTQSLEPDDALLKADALYWTGRFDEAIEAFETAFANLVAADRPAEAGQVSALLAYFAVRRQTFAVAGGWLARAEKLLDGAPESLGHAWLRLLHVGMALFNEGAVEEAIEMCDDAIEFAAKIDSRSTQSVAMSFKGLAMIQGGDWREGLSLMDESMVMAIAGDDLRMTSDVYCNTIAACRNLGDYRRAEEWTEEAERWMHANSVSGYTGACKVHRAELKMIHGSWPDAEEEARRACVELEKFQLVDYLGSAHYSIGEVRRRMGDFDGAEREYEEAFAGGHDAQPGISLLMLDRGDVEGALSSITSAALRRDAEANDEAWRGPSRARLLPALVEIAVAAGDIELASSAADELDEIAEAFDSAVWKASAQACQGSVALAKGDYDVAVGRLERARGMCQRSSLPYEMARTRVLLSKARKGVGDERGAGLELKAARVALVELGAAAEADRIGDLLPEDETAPISKDARVTRTFMFTDIVKSTELIGLIGDSSWRELLAWHNHTLKSAIGEVGGEVVQHTGDGFFASFAAPREAIECAVDIQRRLNRHRSESGFAPLVRIGVHQAEATREAGNYSGGGVHAAARIGAIADAEEVVVSATTLEAAGPIPYPSGEKRPVTLKGITDPIEVSNLDWR